MSEYIQLLHYISQDASLKDFLQKAGRRSDVLESHSSHMSLTSTTNVTKEDLQQVSVKYMLFITIEIALLGKDSSKKGCFSTVTR